MHNSGVGDDLCYNRVDRFESKIVGFERNAQDARQSMSTRPILSTLLLFSFTFCPLHADPRADADRILELAGIKAGFFVHLGSGDGQVAQALKRNDATQVHGLEADASLVTTARDRVRQDGDYGDVAFDQFAGDSLPYVDNLVNLLVIENRDAVTEDEMLRVLTPNGVALVSNGNGQWKKIVKPRPDDIDEWTHYLHDASGNSVANDDVVGPPRHLQWVGSPRWSRHHDRMASMSALVSGGGRMFYIMDEGSRVSIQLPPKWKLIARDAFNGEVRTELGLLTGIKSIWTFLKTTFLVR